jgi:hypothetical protein
MMFAETDHNLNAALLGLLFMVCGIAWVAQKVFKAAAGNEQVKGYAKQAALGALARFFKR